MILDLERFTAAEKPFWEELESHLSAAKDNPFRKTDVEAATRLFYLYQRAAADLARVGELSSEPQTRIYLESLVGRAYAEIHSGSMRQRNYSPWIFLFKTFPRAFRARIATFWVALAITIAGVLFGSSAISLDPEAKPVLMPSTQLLETPRQRVAREESAKRDYVGPHRGSFATQLMTHNIRVAFFVLAAGATWGVGSIVILLYNGITLGAVAADYVGSGYLKFLLGWLMPHGVIEIPAVLIAGQAGLLLANALIGYGDVRSRAARLRGITHDLLALSGGVAVMLLWAGLVEAFLSQYHEPVLPYSLKIGFGGAEFILLFCWLAMAGRK